MKRPTRRPEPTLRRVDFLIPPDRDGKLRSRSRGPLASWRRLYHVLAAILRRTP